MTARGRVSILVAAALGLAAWSGCSSSAKETSRAEDAGRDATHAAVHDGASDGVTDGFTPGVTPGYSAKFRATLANPAPADLQYGEQLYYEDNFGTEVDNEWPPAGFMVKLWQSDVAKWGEQFSNYGFLVDPGDDMPVGLKRGHTNPKLVHETCAACHVGRLPDGRIWSGMPNEHLAWPAFAIAVNDAWVAAGFSSLISPQALQHMQGVLQPGASNVESSTDTLIVPADFPLYVDLGERSHLGYTGAGGDVKSQIFVSILTFGAGTGNIPFPVSEANAITDYLAWTTAPKSLAVDASAAARGATVFADAQCGTCHHDSDLKENGVMKWVMTGPEQLPGPDGGAPQGTIATDGNFYGLTTESGADGGGPGAGINAILQFIAKYELDVQFTNGYCVSDLHALFATAPYLHNGSVPTLADLLNPPSQRPVTFTRDGYTVDTTKDGMSNAGHTFGTTLSASDKSDLIAYLNSL